MKFYGFYTGNESGLKHVWEFNGFKVRRYQRKYLYTMIYMVNVPTNANGCANYEWDLLNIVGRKVVTGLVPKPISRSIHKMVQKNERRDIIIDKF